MITINTDQMFLMVKRLEKINQTFAKGFDDLGMILCNEFKTEYDKFGYTLSFDIDNRLVLLEQVKKIPERQIT